MIGTHSGKETDSYYHHSFLLCTGLACYTIGQKTGLSLGPASYYVAKKNCHNNEITVVCIPLPIFILTACMLYEYIVIYSY